jgi:hypothetical protein
MMFSYAEACETSRCRHTISTRRRSQCTLSLLPTISPSLLAYVSCDHVHIQKLGHHTKSHTVSRQTPSRSPVVMHPSYPPCWATISHCRSRLIQRGASTRGDEGGGGEVRGHARAHTSWPSSGRGSSRSMLNDSLRPTHARPSGSP